MEALAIASPHNDQRSSSGTLDGGDNESPQYAEYRGTKRPFDGYDDQPHTSVVGTEHQHSRYDPATNSSIQLRDGEYSGQSYTALGSHGQNPEVPRYVAGQSTTVESNHRHESNQALARSRPSQPEDSTHGTRQPQASATFLPGRKFKLFPRPRRPHERAADIVSGIQASSSYTRPPEPMETFVIYKPRPQVDPAWIYYFRGIRQGPIEKDSKLPPLQLNLPQRSGPKLPPMEPPPRCRDDSEEERWCVENPMSTLDITLKLVEKTNQLRLAEDHRDGSNGGAE